MKTIPLLIASVLAPHWMFAQTATSEDRVVHVELPENFAELRGDIATATTSEERVAGVAELAKSIPSIRELPIADADTLASALSGDKLTDAQSRAIITSFAKTLRPPDYFPPAGAGNPMTPQYPPSTPPGPSKSEFAILVREVARLRAEVVALNTRIENLAKTE
ncbi:hypothetical protein [Haloferula sargassicola]|uniref:Uncharacterized protein n=1 Tax=Haloferula sargassicola TaxID=490096 RepID=A0ABP9URP2_9BACT